MNSISTLRRNGAIKVICLLPVTLAVAFGAAGTAGATPIVIDFDSLVELDAVTTQFSGLTFTNATILTAGSSLNEFEFPPLSGTNVVFDDGGSLSINFSTPASSFAGHFTYLVPLTVSAFDASNNLVASIGSSFFTNLALSGDPGSSPNEFLELNFAGEISKVTITGDPDFGGSFTLDDVAYTSISEPPAPVPGPSTLFLFLTGIAALIVTRGRYPR